MAEEKFFLGRQPILDRDQKLYGFELLFRSADTPNANVTDYLHASASVIFDSVSSFGFNEILGKHKGFINVNSDMLMSETIELLPQEKVVLEILETVPVTDRVVGRCQELKSKGFSLALDDNSYSSIYVPLYDIVDVIKVDILMVGPENLPAMVKKLERWKAKLLAEKVETHKVYEQCAKLGFQYFQGYYFSRPVVLTRTRVDVGRLAMVRLFNQLVAEVDIRELEETFKQNPNLILNLLRLVNSVSVGLKEKITSLRHAIMVLGYKQLRRWAMMALFTVNAPGGTDNPLLILASARGRFMELLARRLPELMGDKDCPDRAFMAGILSLAEALLKVPMEDIITPLNLDDDVRNAILHHEGALGELLLFAESVEKSDFDAMSRFLEHFALTTENLASVQFDVYNWLNKMDGLS